MITPKDALGMILEYTPVMGRETVRLARCAGRILAADLRAKDPLPPFDNSAMDGYAVRAEDLEAALPEKPVTLAVQQTIRAGAAGALELKPGEAAKIMTGAPLPLGADSVVMVEMTVPGADGRVKISRSVAVGSHIRARGEDVQARSLLLRKGSLLRPYEIALLAAQGFSDIPVTRKPRVAVLATGDELVEPSESLNRGKIRNSNGPALMAGLSRWDIPTLDLGIARDDPGEIKSAMKRALSESDVVLVSGGVSVGDYDYTRALFPELDIQEIFWQVAIKPGKPILFGVHQAPGVPPKIVFGLPGNPISVLVCLEEFVRPALEKLQGCVPKYPSYHLTGKALNEYPKPKDRQQYLFCSARPSPDGYELRIIRPQGSAMLGMAAQANALAVSPIGVARVREGDDLPFRWLK